MELARHGYNHMIVWLDKNIASPGCCHELKKAFATTTNPESSIQTSIDEMDINNLIRDGKGQQDTSFLDVPFPFILFDAIEPYLTFLLANAGKKRIFFITSGELGEHIVPRILNNHQEIFKDNNGNIYKDSIYVFCANIPYHSQWVLDYVDIECIKIENDDRLVLARITRDIADYLKSNGVQELPNNNTSSIELPNNNTSSIELPNNNTSSIELPNNNTSSIELAIQYFGWAKNLYEQADRVRPAYAPSDPLNPINITSSLLVIAEQKLRDLPRSSDENADDVATSVEN